MNASSPDKPNPKSPVPGISMEVGCGDVSEEGKDVMKLDNVVEQGIEVPAVLRMDKESFEKCSGEEKIELTKDLTPEQLSELYIKFEIKSESPEEPQAVLDELNLLRKLEAGIINCPGTFACPTVLLGRVVALKGITERVWRKCLENISAYAKNRDFFKNTLNAFMEEIQLLPDFKMFVQYSVSNDLTKMRVFCELNSFYALLQNLAEIWWLTSARNAFEGLSDELVALTADYMRCTINISKLHFMLEDSQAFTGANFGMQGNFIDKPLLLSLLVNLKKIVKELDESDLMRTHGRILSALDVIRKTKVPVDEAWKIFVADHLSWEVVSLATKASMSISVACDQAELTSQAQSVIADIERITMLLHHGKFNMGCGVSEQQMMMGVGSRNFVVSMLEIEKTSPRPVFETLKKASETLSELLNNFLDSLKGGDETWTFRLCENLGKAHEIWTSALEVLSFGHIADTTLLWINYIGRIDADFFVILHMTELFESLEDSVTFNGPTRTVCRVLARSSSFSKSFNSTFDTRKNETFP